MQSEAAPWTTRKARGWSSDLASGGRGETRGLPGGTSLPLEAELEEGNGEWEFVS